MIRIIGFTRCIGIKMIYRVFKINPYRLNAEERGDLQDG